MLVLDNVVAGWQFRYPPGLGSDIYKERYAALYNMCNVDCGDMQSSMVERFSDCKVSKAEHGQSIEAYF